MTLTTLMWILAGLFLLCTAYGFWAGFRFGKVKGYEQATEEADAIWRENFQEFQADAHAEYAKAFSAGAKAWQDKYNTLNKQHIEYVLEHGGQ